jgi:hypothetical protein
MPVLTAIFRPIFDLLLGPFQGLPAMVTLLPISIGVTIAALYVFKWTSDQEASEEAQRAIHAGIFEIRLFNDDLRAIFAAQLAVVWQVLKKFRYALTPLLWMLVPLFILVSQLQFHYGYSGFVEGDRVIVTAELVGEPDVQRFGEQKPAFRLEAPDGVTVETPTLWIPALNQVTWRVQIDELGEYELTIIDPDGGRTTKSLVASENIVRRSVVRGSTLFDQLYCPAEAPLEAESPFQRITIDYPETNVSLFGWELNWIIAFLLMTFVFGFVLMKPIGVTI